MATLSAASYAGCKAPVMPGGSSNASFRRCCPCSTATSCSGGRSSTRALEASASGRHRLWSTPSRGMSVRTRGMLFETVEDCMTSGHIYSCKPETTIDDALELLVEHRITGLPVVDDDQRVVGVVSDFDILALDALGSSKTDRALFPETDQTWQAFKEVKRLLAKTAGRQIKDVMTNSPITVKPNTDLESAAKILLTKKIHRLPVVDESGKLIGIISRGNLIKAVLAAHKAALSDKAALQAQAGAQEKTAL